MAVVTEQDGGRARLLETRVARVFFTQALGTKFTGAFTPAQIEARSCFIPEICLAHFPRF